MESIITIQEIRGMLLKKDLRPLLRLLPMMDELCRGYTISHIGTPEDVAEQAWVLNAIDWARQEDFYEYYKDIVYAGYDRAVHKSAYAIAFALLENEKDFMLERKKDTTSNKILYIFDIKKKWINNEIDDATLIEYHNEYNNYIWSQFKDKTLWEDYWYLLRSICSATGFDIAFNYAKTVDFAFDLILFTEDLLNDLNDLLLDTIENEVGITCEHKLTLDSKVFNAKRLQEC